MWKLKAKVSPMVIGALKAVTPTGTISELSVWKSAVLRYCTELSNFQVSDEDLKLRKR